jgi:hypothetical protein
MRASLGAAITAAALVSIPAVQVQSQTISPPLSMPGPKSCPPDIAKPPLPPNETSGSRTLSEQLSESKGVICPPAGVDPGLAATPPATDGKMPVIPPPGTPGGDPSIVPK